MIKENILLIGDTIALILQTTLNDRLKRGWTLEQALTISTKGLKRKVFK